MYAVQVINDAAPAHLEGQAPVEPSRTAGRLQLPAFTTRPLQEGLLAGRHSLPAASRGMGPLEAGAAASQPAEASIRHAAAPQSTIWHEPEPEAAAAESMELGADAGSRPRVPGVEADEPIAVPGSRLHDVPENLLGEAATGPPRSNRLRPASAGTRPAAADLRPRSTRPSSASVTAEGGSRAGLVHSMSAFQVSPRVTGPACCVTAPPCRKCLKLPHCSCVTSLVDAEHHLPAGQHAVLPEWKLCVTCGRDWRGCWLAGLQQVVAAKLELNGNRTDLTEHWSTWMQALADVAAADAVAAKGGLHANAGQIKLALRSIVTDAVKRGMQSAADAPATAQQSVLRHTLAKHGDHELSCLAHARVQCPEGHHVSFCIAASAPNSHSDGGQR